MAWGIGQKGDKFDQSASHVRSNVPSRFDPAPEAPKYPEKDPRQEVKAFQRQLVYDQQRRLGKSISDALNSIASKKILIGTRLTPREIKQVIDTGKLQKKRI